MSDYYFAVGSLKFKTFKELYDNIKGRTNGFKKNCHVINGTNDNTVMSFPLAYEGGSKNRFVLTWTEAHLMGFKSIAALAPDLKEQLPGFKRVGSTAPGAANGQQLYGYIDIAKLG